jgi:hypothetical protein
VFICGDDAGPKQLVEQLVRDLGAQPVDAGPLTAARLVAPAMMLLVSIAYAGVPATWSTGADWMRRPDRAARRPICARGISRQQAWSRAQMSSTNKPDGQRRQQ